MSHVMWDMRLPIGALNCLIEASEVTEDSPPSEVSVQNQFAHVTQQRRVNIKCSTCKPLAGWHSATYALLRCEAIAKNW
eukprot:scaffold293052_cov20-Tisochrysis_lutea.AAC.2